MDYKQIGMFPNRTNFSTESVHFQLRKLWKFKTSFPMIGDPVISGKMLFIEGAESSVGKKTLFPPVKVFALDADRGRPEWEYTIEGGRFAVGRNCLVDDMIITSDRKDLFALKDGKEVWKGEGLGGDWGWPVIHNGMLIVSRSKDVIMVDPWKGKLLRKFEVSSPTSVACYQDKVVFGERTALEKRASLYCIHRDTAELIWKRDVSEAGKFYDEIESRRTGKEVIRLGHFGGVFPVIDGERIYVGLERYMCCFDLETGELIWKTRGAGTPICKDGRVYSFKGTYFFCSDATNGEAVYERHYVHEGSFLTSLPFISGDSFFVGTGTGLYAFDIRTGEKAWEFHSRKKSGIFLSQPVFIDGRLYAGCTDGYVYCFESRKNKESKD